MILQDLCRNKYVWHDEIPNEFLHCWQVWLQGLHKLGELAIDRCFKSPDLGEITSCHDFHVGVTALRTLSTISFFHSAKFFYIFKRLKRIICTIFLCNKKYRSPCLFKRKGAFISLLSLLWGKSLTFCTSMDSCAHANDANSVRNRDAQCNTEESP